MKKIDDILKDFSDYELAMFVTYRQNQYMQGTQEKIKAYLTERKLTDSEINILTANKPEPPLDEKIHCSRCNSVKLIRTRVKWEIPAFRAGYEDEAALWNELVKGEATYKDKVECFVCGNILYDPNNEKRTFIQRLADIIFDKPLPI